MENIEPAKPTVSVVSDVFDTQLATDWDLLYNRDPEANFFLSSAYLLPLIKSVGSNAHAITVTYQDKLIGLFPIDMQAQYDKKFDLFFTHIRTPGRSFWADYCGFLIDPDLEEMAITGLALALKRLPWGSMSLDFWKISDRRRAMFLDQFETENYACHDVPDRTDSGTTNNLICPRTALPESFDLYLEGLGRNTRQKLRRCLRQLEGGSLSIRAGTEDDIGTVVNLWRIRWKETKGKRIDQLCHTAEHALRVGLGAGIMELPVLEKDGRIIGALANYPDAKKGEILFFLAARDLQERQSNAGLTLHAFAIKNAIERGFKVYDFLRGDETYKFQLGALSETVWKTKILRDPEGANLFHPSCEADLLNDAARWLQRGDKKLAKAAIDYVSDRLD